MTLRTVDDGPTAADLLAIDNGTTPDDQRMVFEAVPEIDAVAITVELHAVVVELRRIVDILERPSVAVASMLHR
mgnify:CR=1 FL=1|tara:strand:- start:232 stop:453 length:222 start_codon:yes stop_codon:yes gene_type:complete